MASSRQADVLPLRVYGVVLLLLGASPALSLAQPSAADTSTPRLLRSTGISLHTPPVILQHQEVWVVVRVQTRQGQPVTGQLVEFGIDSPATVYARVEPRRVVTHQGVARARLRADIVGVVHLTARIGLQTKRAAIKVMLPMARPGLPETPIRRQAGSAGHRSLLTPVGSEYGRTTGHSSVARRVEGCKADRCTLTSQVQGRASRSTNPWSYRARRTTQASRSLWNARHSRPVFHGRHRETPMERMVTCSHNPGGSAEPS